MTYPQIKSDDKGSIVYFSVGTPPYGLLQVLSPLKDEDGSHHRKLLDLAQVMQPLLLETGTIEQVRHRLKSKGVVNLRVEKDVKVFSIIFPDEAPGLSLKADFSGEGSP